MILTLLTALVVMTLRIALYFIGFPAEGTDFMLVHFLAIVTIVFFAGQRLLSIDPQADFPGLLRDGFRNAALYALLMMIFLWLYYTHVEAGLFATKIDERVAMGMAEGQPEEVIRSRMERFFTPFNYATITFFALLITGAFQAFLIGLVHHKLLRRFMQ